MPDRPFADRLFSHLQKAAWIVCMLVVFWTIGKTVQGYKRLREIPYPPPFTDMVIRPIPQGKHGSQSVDDLPQITDEDLLRIEGNWVVAEYWMGDRRVISLNPQPGYGVEIQREQFRFGELSTSKNLSKETLDSYRYRTLFDMTMKTRWDSHGPGTFSACSGFDGAAIDLNTQLKYFAEDPGIYMLDGNRLYLYWGSRQNGQPVELPEAIPLRPHVRFASLMVLERPAASEEPFEVMAERPGR